MRRLSSGRRGSYRTNMASKLIISAIFCLIFLTLGGKAKPRPERSNENIPNFGVERGAPIITPLLEYVELEEHTNYTLSCVANEPIMWEFENKGTDEEADGDTDAEKVSFKIKQFNTTDERRPYGLKLYLMDVSHVSVGNYYCIKKASASASMQVDGLIELVNDDKAASIYVYVNDKTNLLAHVNTQIVAGFEYEYVTIPCRPTMPNVEVLLTTPNGDTFDSQNTGRYDPQRGFVVEIRGVTDSGDYTCRPKVPSLANEEEEQSITIHFVGNEQVNQTLEKTPMEAATAVPPTAKKPRKTAISHRSNRATTKRDTSKSTVTNHIVNVTNRTVVLTATPTSASVIGDMRLKRDTINTFNVVAGVGEGDVVMHNENTNDGVGVVQPKKIFPHNNASYNLRNKIEYATVTADSDYDYEGADVEAAKIVVLNTTPAMPAVTTSTKTSRRSSAHYYRTSRPKTKYIERPTMNSKTIGHAFVGEDFNITCEAKTMFDVKYSTDWELPTGVDKSRTHVMTTGIINTTESHNIGHSILQVKNAQKGDAGKYTCTITDHSGNKAHSTYHMTVLNKGESYIEIYEQNGYYQIANDANKKIVINVKYRGHPLPTLKWYNPNRTEIYSTSKYSIDTTMTAITLNILNAQMEDSGAYVIEARNDFVTKQLTFNVSISDVPRAEVKDVYVQANKEANVVCKVLSFPIANVSWVFEPCKISPRWPACHEPVQRFESTRAAVAGSNSIEYLHYLDFTPKSPGIIKCEAHNRKGKGVGKGHILIGDISENMTIYGFDVDHKIARGDEVEITCAALAYYFSDDLDWFKNGEIVTETDNILVTSTKSDFSYKKTLRFRHIRDFDSDNYECSAREANNYERQQTKSISIFVHEPSAPKMAQQNFDDGAKIERKLGESLELICKADAIPAPTIDWYKDDVKVVSSNSTLITEDNTNLLVPFIRPEDVGTYKCVVANRLGTIESKGTVEISNLPGIKLSWILGILVFLFFLLGLVIYLCIRVKRERRLLRELKAAGLANFEEGAVEHINPALTLDEQADLLPYDRCFEFPREKLKLGKQLGAGAFGVVLKAHAEGIKPDEKETIVAVKMVKRTADNEVMRALVSELKIMVHLGQHLNVVNLLGAVTKNIAKRELMVIVEYCRYGNIQNFLLRNRKRFINQINPDTDKIDPTITVQRLSDNFELSRNRVKYVNLMFDNHQYVNHMNNKNNNYTANNPRNSDNDPRSGTRAGRPNSSGYSRQSDLYEGHVDSCATEQTVMTTIPEDEDNILSNNSVQPAWRSNYKPDSTEAMTITTMDLVSWAFQVARGMDYLSSKKVLHGDLAARNILLCENNVVKICDFGLARTMYKNDNYKKQGEAPLPIKWLALESLSDHVFSTYTDVWSFGIVMWELFSLAKVPYPGMDPNQSLYLKLKDGYRMEKPPFANDDLYDIMLECWRTNPESRPLFHALEKRFAQMLGDEVTNHYVDLNDPYLRVNTEYMKRNQTDYLALMGSPDEMAPAPPRYVNGHVLPEIRIEPSSSDDYLQMSTDAGTAIFSPTRPKDYDSSTDAPNTTKTTSFTFSDEPTLGQPHSPTLANNLDSPANKQLNKESMQPEEIPMLHGAHQGSDNEQSPEQFRKYTPTAPPRHIIETQLGGDDNYVNVKSPKKALNNNSGRTADAFSNPSYQILKAGNK